MYKLVIFDLDGTLLNTIDDITESVNYALNKNSVPEITLHECQYMVGRGVDFLIDKAVKNHKEAFENVKNDYLTYYALHSSDKTKPYVGIIPTIKELNKRNIEVAVLSNKPHEDVLRIVEYYFKDCHFDLVMGKKEKNRPKPSIDGCLEIKETLQIFSDILYVGDTNIDMETAAKAGFPSVAVTWGFRKKEELEGYKYIIDKPEELLNIVDENK